MKLQPSRRPCVWTTFGCTRKYLIESGLNGSARWQSLNRCGSPVSFKALVHKGLGESLHHIGRNAVFFQFFELEFDRPRRLTFRINRGDQISVNIGFGSLGVPRRRGQIREGIAYAWRTFDLRLPLLVMAVIFTFGFNFSVLLPLLALRTFHGSSSTYGVMLTLFGVGSLIGALAMASHTRRANTRLLAAFGLAFGVVTVAVGVSPSLHLEWPLLLILGAVAISFAITANSTLQLTSSDEMRGRVMSLYTVVFLGSTPVGGFVAGLVGQHLGPRIGLVAGGLLSVAAALAGMAALAGRRSVHHGVPVT